MQEESREVRRPCDSDVTESTFLYRWRLENRGLEVGLIQSRGSNAKKGICANISDYSSSSTNKCVSFRCGCVSTEHLFPVSSLLSPSVSTASHYYIDPEMSCSSDSCHVTDISLLYLHMCVGKRLLSHEGLKCAELSLRLPQTSSLEVKSWNGSVVFTVGGLNPDLVSSTEVDHRSYSHGF